MGGIAEPMALSPFTSPARPAGPVVLKRPTQLVVQLAAKRGEQLRRPEALRADEGGVVLVEESVEDRRGGGNPAAEQPGTELPDEASEVAARACRRIASLLVLGRAFVPEQRRRHALRELSNCEEHRGPGRPCFGEA